MPLALTLHLEPAQRLRVRVHQTEDPAWRRLHQIADAVAPELAILWATVFNEVRDAIPEAALRDALASANPLLVEDVLAPLWHRLGEAQAQRLLPPHVRETVQRAAEVMVPTTEAMLGVSIDASFNVVVPETLTAIDQYVGTQIRGITDLTLQNVRQVIRNGFSEGRSLMQMMRDLEAFVGLTPRQTQAVEALRQRLTDQGLSRAQVQQRVQEASQRALRQRVESVVRTESITMSSMGQDLLWQRAVADGLLDVNRFRRFWLVAGNPCPKICARIPGMNPEGVRLGEPFSTPAGQIMYPSAHPMCRCAVTARVA